MANLNWQKRRNLENSFAEFLQTETSGLTVFYKGANQIIDVRVGNAPQGNWVLPNISVYMDTKTAPRAFVGNNKRFESYLLIIDVRALDDGMRSDLAEWVSKTINDGFDYYDYTPTVGDPENPSKVLSGKVSINFVSDTPLRGTPDSNLYDKFRHNISVSATIAI